MSSAIYAIVNNTTLDLYVGSAVALNRRWNVHRHQLRKGVHSNQHLQNAFAKYGESGFDFEVLERVPDRSALLSREQFWINFLNPEYNKQRLAASSLGSVRSEESRLKMSIAAKGRKQSPETIEKRRLSLIGHKVTPETRSKISNSHIGIRPTEETRVKMSNAGKGRKQSPETVARRMETISARRGQIT